MQPLSDLHRDILDFEAAHPQWKYYGAKQAAIREQLDITDARYAQVLDHVLDLPEALAYRPAVVNRLRRLREARRAVRTAS